MGAIASQITSLTIVYSTVYSDADQCKHHVMRQHNTLATHYVVPFYIWDSRGVKSDMRPVSRWNNNDIDPYMMNMPQHLGCNMSSYIVTHENFQKPFATKIDAGVRI